MPDLTFGTIALMPIIVGLVELAKRYFNLKSEHAPILSALLAVLGYALIVAVQIEPSLQSPIQHGLTALIVFLSASGLYSVGKTVVSK